MIEEPTNDPMHQRLWRMNGAPRCRARTRRGSPCRSPALAGKRRCRMHGGAAGSGAREGNRNALKHGLRSAEALALRRRVRVLLHESRELVELVK